MTKLGSSTSGHIDPDIPTDFLATINSQVSLGGDGEQKFYLLGHDSIESVLHKRMSALNAGSNCIGWVGISLSIIITLSTAKFEKTLGLPPEYINAIFVVGLCVFFVLSIIDGLAWWKGRLTPEQLASELGKKGLKPKK